MHDEAWRKWLVCPWSFVGTGGVSDEDGGLTRGRGREVLGSAKALTEIAQKLESVLTARMKFPRGEW